MIGMGNEVDLEVAVGGFIRVGATVAGSVAVFANVGASVELDTTVVGRVEAGAVAWLGVQPEKTTLKAVTIINTLPSW
jgi:hypothetical protein